MNTNVTERIQAEFKGLCLGFCRGDCSFFFSPKSQKIPFIQGTKKNLVYLGSAFCEGKIRISR